MVHRKIKSTVICSPSTRNFIKGDRYIIVKNPPDETVLFQIDSIENVICVGGGAVIDYAKIVSKGPIKECYPTTASGSSETSHAVYWIGDKKMGIKRNLPEKVIIEEKFFRNLSSDMFIFTMCDMIAHCLDVKWSLDSNPESLSLAEEALSLIENKDKESLIRAGILAGRAIEITPTTILHSLSYPLTGIYGISHGKALSYLIPRISQITNDNIPDIEYIKDLGDIDWKLIVEEAYKYEKIKKVNFKISKKILINILESKFPIR